MRAIPNNAPTNVAALDEKYRQEVELRANKVATDRGSHR